MAAADHAGPDGDLYQLLGVSREASREEIALALLAELALQYLARDGRRPW